MEDSIKNFPKQFEWQPVIENQKKLKRKGRFIFCGMGGSHLAADILKLYNPTLQAVIHKDYGLPNIPNKELKDYLVVAVSFSGNTEETIDSFLSAKEQKLNIAVISKGGKLLDLAKESSCAYIQLPIVDIQPRMALGYTFRALLKIIGDEGTLLETEELAKSLRPLDYKSPARALAEKLKGFIPVIYSSAKNEAIAYNWKIKFNETSKIPAFHNVFPELNHNEMTGFDAIESTRQLSEKFFFLFFKGDNEHPRILKRMELLEKMYKERGFGVETIELVGGSPLQKIFTSIILADWTALFLSQYYGTEPEKVIMNEEFKKLL